MQFPEFLSSVQKLDDRIDALLSDVQWCHSQITMFKRQLLLAMPAAEDYFRGPVPRETSEDTDALPSIYYQTLIDLPQAPPESDLAP